MVLKIYIFHLFIILKRKKKNRLIGLNVSIFHIIIGNVLLLEFGIDYNLNI